MTSRLPLLTYLLLTLLISALGCGKSYTTETVNVTLKNTETYEYPTVGGEEEGARVSAQASHFSVSEIRRDSATNWVAVYVYRPATGFVGSDRSEVEILTGSDGGSAPSNVKKVVFHFAIHD
jgi:hypothetical protein